jgi:hemoglobin
MKLALCFVLATAACAHEAAAPSNHDKRSLYDRLGQKPAITLVVDRFLQRVLADERINARFFNIDATRLRNLLIEQICQASGGPCTYTGRDMKTAHTSMGIDEGEWSALIADLKGALDDYKVPAREQNDLLGAFGPMKPDIVGR